MTGAGIENGGIMGNAGFTGLMFRGMPIISDEKCPTGTMYFLNEKHLDLYEIPPNEKFVKGTKGGFAFTGWMRPNNQDALTSQIIIYCQLMGSQPRKQSVRTSISS